MKANIEDFLHKIDLAFKDKSQKDTYLSYIMIISVIFAFSYLLFWDVAENDFLEKKQQIETIQAKLNKDKQFLQHNPEAKISKLSNDIKQAKQDLLIYRDYNEYIKTKIEAISSLIYDERAWGEYLHSISINADKYKIKIINFTNKYSSKHQSFGHVLDISLKVTGEYKNILKFINSLEQSELVVDIHTVDIKAQDSLNSDLNISVWGITY